MERGIFSEDGNSASAAPKPITGLSTVQFGDLTQNINNQYIAIPVSVLSVK